MIKHIPATPLPWDFRDPSRGTQPQPEYPTKIGIYSSAGYESVGCSYVKHRDTDAAKADARYIAHAANAYPRLVEALREVVRQAIVLSKQTVDLPRETAQDCDALLRALGEE